MKSASLITLCFLLSNFTFAQSEDNNEKIKIFMDCTRDWLCDQDYLRTELKMVDFVRDRFASEIQIIQTTQFTGGGGENNVLAFQGLGRFANINDTLTYFNTVVATEDMKRKKMVQFLKIGLMQYMAKTPWAEAMTITYANQDSTKKEPAKKDPYNLWQFSFGISGFFNGDKNNASSSVNGNNSASRESEKERFTMFLNNNTNREKYNYYYKNAAGIDTSETFTAKRDAQSGYMEYVHKLTTHWGMGITSRVQRSVYQNLDIRLSASPKVEYSLFPYKDFNTQRITFNYEIGPQYSNYSDTTIYFKTKEILLQQSFNINSSFTKQWGSLNLGVGFEHYISDIKKNNLFIGGGVEWNIFKGFKFGIGGNFQFIHDQISIPKEGATLEEVLIKSRIIATNYDYFFGVGCSYTFGSIFNSQVNPTFKGLNYSLNF